MYWHLILWLKNHLLPCPYKQIFGIECPVCGFQRSFISLLEGNISDSILQFPAMFPLIITSVLFLVFYLFKTQNRKLIIQKVLLFDLSIMIISCLVKNILNIC